MTKGTVTTDIVYLPINEVSWLVSRNNNNNNLNRGIPRVPLLVSHNPNLHLQKVLLDKVSNHVNIVMMAVIVMTWFLYIR